MKKIFLILCGLALSFSAYSQTDTSKIDDYLSRKGKFALHTSYKLGFSQLNSLTYKNLNGNIQVGEMLASYGFSKNGTISTGIALIDFNANVFNNGVFQNLRNEYIQIPLKGSIGYGLGKSRTTTTQAIIGGGFFGTYHRKSTLEGQNSTITEKNLTWSVGLSFEFGIELSIYKNMNIGIGVESQFGDPTRGDNHKMNLTSNMLKFSFIYIP